MVSWGIIGFGDVMVDSIYERKVQTYIQREIHYYEIGQDIAQNFTPGTDKLSSEGLLCVRQLTHFILKVPDRVGFELQDRLHTDHRGTFLHMIESIFGSEGIRTMCPLIALPSMQHFSIDISWTGHNPVEGTANTAECMKTVLLAFPGETCKEEEDLCEGN